MLRDRFVSQRENYLSALGELVQLQGALVAIEDMEGVESAFTLSWREPIEIHLTLASSGGEETVAEIRRRLHLRHATRIFDEKEGKVQWTIPGVTLGGKAAVVKVSTAPSRCKIELVEEDVLVPAQPARVEKKKRYRILNPEECFAPTPSVEEVQ